MCKPAYSDRRAASNSKPWRSPRQHVGARAMLQLSSRDDDADDTSGDDDATFTDHKMAFWVPRGDPGIYEICWNAEIAPNSDPSAYSESLGILEMLQLLSISGKCPILSLSHAQLCSGRHISPQRRVGNAGYGIAFLCPFGGCPRHAFHRKACYKFGGAADGDSLLVAQMRRLSARRTMLIVAVWRSLLKQMLPWRRAAYWL